VVTEERTDEVRTLLSPHYAGGRKGTPMSSRSAWPIPGRAFGSFMSFQALCSRPTSATALIRAGRYYD
jgi:hypothetical protein